MSTHPDVVKASDVDPVVSTTYVRGKSVDMGRRPSAEPAYGASGSQNLAQLNREGDEEAALAPKKKREWFRYVKTKQFWIVLVCGQVLSLVLTGTNTLSSQLAGAGANIPAFQTFFNYVLLAIVWVSISIYKMGFKGYGNMLKKRGWKYFILSFFDVEGNYFTVLGYRYTTILSMQLLNFWAIVVVVILSFFLLKVRYNWAQVIGVFVCIGGMGILFASDHITGSNVYAAPNALKGDLFGLLGATCYGFSNTGQEYLVSEAPIYEVVGMIGLWGMIINGVQAGIFDRSSFRAAQKVYTAKIGGWIAGFDLLLFLFYSVVPIIFRMGDAAFLNISLLTSNFWGTIVGIEVFHLTVHWMYPIAFVLIMVGLIVYFLMDDSSFGTSLKPWLGRNQEKGVDGVGTAKRRMERPEVVM